NGLEGGHVHFYQSIVVVDPRWAEWDAVFQIEKKTFDGQWLAYAHAVLFIAKIDHINPVHFVDDLFQACCFGLFEHLGTDLADGDGRISPQLAAPSRRNHHRGQIQQGRLQEYGHRGWAWKHSFRCISY